MIDWGEQATSTLRAALVRLGLPPSEAKKTVRSLGLDPSALVSVLTADQRELLARRLRARAEGTPDTGQPPPAPLAEAGGPPTGAPPQAPHAGAQRGVVPRPAPALAAALDVESLSGGDAPSTTPPETLDTGLSALLKRVGLLARAYALAVRSWELAGTGEVPAAGAGLNPDLVRHLLGQPMPRDRQHLLQRCALELRAVGVVGAEAPQGGSEHDFPARLHRFGQGLGLGPAALDLLGVFVACEHDARIAWILQVLGNSRLMGSHSRLFLLHLMSGAPDIDPQQSMAALAPGSALLGHQVLQAGADRSLRLSGECAQFLLGPPRTLPWEFRGIASLERDEAAATAGAEVFPAELLDRTNAALDARHAVLLLGAMSADTRPLVCALAERRGVPVLRVRTDELLLRAQGEEDDPGAELAELLREARLAGALLLMEQAACLVPGSGEDQRKERARGRLLATLRTPDVHRLLELGSGVELRSVVQLVERLGALPVHIPVTERDVRERHWSMALEPTESGTTKRDKLATSLAAYPLGVDQIRRAVGLVESGYRPGGRASRQDREAALHRICHDMVSHRLQELAARVRPRGEWDDLILLKETAESLSELRAYAKHMPYLLEKWGFDRKLKEGRAISALFSGASGTGKTMAAGLVAMELGIELFRIDLSRIVSKYVGETEQRLSMLFGEASEIGAGLLFDEADSLFSGRTQVKSSSDKYANLEVNYLLQKMEEFEGLVILTTNFPQFIDQAFLRRIKFKVTFERPGPEERAKLWELFLADGPRLARSVDFKAIGKEYDLTGGEIRNAALRAGIYARRRNRAIANTHLRQAAERELHSLGRLVRVD